MYLFINTCEDNKTTVSLIQNNRRLNTKVVQGQYHQSEKLLGLIDRLLTSLKIKLNKIKGIIVVSGPGSFTSVRIGVVVANVLAYGLQIPIVGIKSFRIRPDIFQDSSGLRDLKKLDFLIKKGVTKLKKKRFFSTVVPFYGREPNITIGKRRI